MSEHENAKNFKENTLSSLIGKDYLANYSAKRIINGQQIEELQNNREVPENQKKGLDLIGPTL